MTPDPRSHIRTRKQLARPTPWEELPLKKCPIPGKKDSESVRIVEYYCGSKTLRFPTRERF